MAYKLHDNPYSNDDERNTLKSMFDKYTKKDDKWEVHRYWGDPWLKARWIVTTPDKASDRVHCYTLDDVEKLLSGYKG